MVRERVYRGIGLLVAVVLAAGVWRLIPGPVAAGTFTLPGTATDQLAVAADALEAAMAAGGSGLTFEVVQRNTLYARPGGPRIGLPSPDDPRIVVAEVDEFAVNAILSRGAVTADAFWMEMRLAPGVDEAPAFATSHLFSKVLLRAGVIWRDDGDGWYETDASPGTGMDPASARLLPKLLRSATDVASVDPELHDGRLLPGVRGTAKIDDYPGVVASDGRLFTEPTFEIRYWLDESGRLVRLEARARNLNQTTYDLVSQTIVTVGYGSTGDPPEPNPTMPPQPAPTDEPDAEVRS